jgi:tight adherence protein C
MACGAALAAGVLARDHALGTAVRRREELIIAEFPSVADLLALSVAAGEGPVSAIERVVQRSDGELARDLAGVLGEVRTGTPVTHALDGLAARTGVPTLARFAEGLAVALDRGTPLVDVLHAQAADVREAGRRVLIETGARKEVAMMLPVVFLILPVTVLFAFYPGVIGLDLSSP